MSNALALQVGGNHYKKMPIQPVEFAMLNELNKCQSDIIKYACRYRDKGGAGDLQKAIHYCDLWVDIAAAHGLTWDCVGIEWRREAGLPFIPLPVFIGANNLPRNVAQVVVLICATPTPARVKTARAVLVEMLMDGYGVVA